MQKSVFVIQRKSSKIKLFRKNNKILQLKILSSKVDLNIPTFLAFEVRGTHEYNSLAAPRLYSGSKGDASKCDPRLIIVQPGHFGNIEKSLRALYSEIIHPRQPQGPARFT